jgi:Tol biopolymer transport system component
MRACDPHVNWTSLEPSLGRSTREAQDSTINFTPANRAIRSARRMSTRGLPDGSVIAYTDLIAAARIVHVRLIDPDGKTIATPELPVRVGGERYRFTPGRRQLVYMCDTDSTTQTFWIHDFAANSVRQLADFDIPGTRTFDITPDGTRIVFDRLSENADIVLIDLPDRAGAGSR